MSLGLKQIAPEVTPWHVQACLAFKLDEVFFLIGKLDEVSELQKWLTRP